MQVRRYEIVVKNELIDNKNNSLSARAKDTEQIIPDSKEPVNVVENKESNFTFGSAAVKGLAVATMAVGTYQTVAHLVNTQKAASLVINGDLLAAQHLQIRQNNIDKAIGMGGTMIKGAFAGAVTGSMIGPIGAAVGAAVGTIYAVGNSIFRQANDYLAQMRVYNQNVTNQSYFGSLEAERLVNYSGRVRWIYNANYLKYIK